MERGAKPCYGESDNEETGEADLIEVFGVEEQVWNAQVFPEISSDHRKKNDPAQDQDVVTLYIIKE